MGKLIVIGSYAKYIDAEVKMRMSKLIQKMNPILIIIALFMAQLACANVLPQAISASGQDWQEDFNLADRKLSHTGESKYFVLKPGFQTIYESPKEKLTITVLDETKEINGITTRVVEEREEKDGEVIEISRNFFAIDEATGDAFYFGEEVDDYKNGQIVNHSGAWLAYENGNKPGLIMPGTPEIGMKYYQELAPKVAMDRAEVISTAETFATPAGEFENCLVTEESSAISSATERKTYAPGIGLIQDQALLLVSYGYVDETNLQH